MLSGTLLGNNRFPPFIGGIKTKLINVKHEDVIYTEIDYIF